MADELQRLPGRPAPSAAGAWCEAARSAMRKPIPAAPPLVVLRWKGDTLSPADAHDVIAPGDIVTMRIEGADFGGVEAVLAASMLDPGDTTDPAARFLAEHACPWEVSLCSAPGAPERDVAGRWPNVNR